MLAGTAENRMKTARIYLGSLVLLCYLASLVGFITFAAAVSTWALIPAVLWAAAGLTAMQIWMDK